MSPAGTGENKAMQGVHRQTGHTRFCNLFALPRAGWELVLAYHICRKPPVLFSQVIAVEGVNNYNGLLVPATIYDQVNHLCSLYKPSVVLTLCSKLERNVTMDVSYQCLRAH